MSAPSTIPTAATPDVCTVGVLVDGQALPGRYHVLSVRVTRELNRIPSATLHIKDGDAAQQSFEASESELFVPGHGLSIQLGYRSQEETVFEGVVVRQTLRARRSGAQLVVECKDAAVQLTRGARSAYYVETSDSEVMEELIERHGLSADVAPTEPSPLSLVQYDCSDWDFLLCRAEANGHDVRVVDGTVHTGPPDPSAEPALHVAFGATLLELDLELDAREQSESLSASAWSAAEQSRSASEASEPAASTAGNLDAPTLASALSAGEEQLAHGGALSEPELQAWADARLARQRHARVRGRASFQGFAGLQPGDTLAVEGVGARFEGSLYVSGVRHSVSAGNWQTDAQLGVDPTPFARRSDVARLPAGGLLPAAQGLQIGVVTALAGDPEGEHRIQVRLPFVSEDEDGIWARLATLDAGPERGTYVRPEVDDEVVVGFLDADPRHAVVLGMLHSSAHAPPEELSDDNHLKGYTSREGLQQVFDDEQKRIHWATPEGNQLTLSEEEGGIALQDQNGNSIVLSADGIAITSAGEILLEASSGVTVSGMDIELSASSSLSASGSSSAELKGASTTVEGSATLTVSGGIVQIN